MDPLKTPKSVLITGAASGIGLACCDRFLEAGWTVHGWDVSGGGDDRVTWRRVDVSDWDAVAAAASEHVALDAVVNCAAIARLAPIMEMTRDDWDPDPRDQPQRRVLRLPARLPRARRPRRRARAGRLRQLEEHDARPLAVQRLEGRARVLDAGAGRRVGACGFEGARPGGQPGITRTPQPMLRIETGAITEEKLLIVCPRGAGSNRRRSRRRSSVSSATTSARCTARTCSSMRGTTRGAATFDAGVSGARRQGGARDRGRPRNRARHRAGVRRGGRDGRRE